MAYIVKAYRTAVGKAGRGGFSNYRSDDLAVDLISHLLAQVPQLDPKRVDCLLYTSMYIYGLKLRDYFHIIKIINV